MWLYRGIAARKLDRLDVAKDSLNRARALREDFRVLQELALVLYRSDRGTFDECRQLLSKAEKALPEGSVESGFRLHRDAGSLFAEEAQESSNPTRRQDLLGHAIRHYTIANRDRTDDQKIQFSLGYVYHLSNQLASAIGWYKKATEKPFPRASYCLACALLHEGDAREAIDHFRIAQGGFKRDGSDRDAMNCEIGIARCYFDLTKYSLAVAHSKIAHESDPQSLRFAMVYSECLFADGKKSEAIDLLGAILKDAPESCADAHELLSTWQGKDTTTGRWHTVKAQELRNAKRGFFEKLWSWGMGNRLSGNCNDPFTVSAAFEPEAAISHCVFRGWKCSSRCDGALSLTGVAREQ